MPYTPTPLDLVTPADSNHICFEKVNQNFEDINATLVEVSTLLSGGFNYFKTDLTGGVGGSLDEIDGSLLSDGNTAIVLVGKNPARAYFFVLDADKGGAEDPPYTIMPDANADSKRWVLAARVSRTWIGSAPPASSDDYNTGVSNGDWWICGGNAYICVSETAGNAVWRMIPQLGTGATNAAAGDHNHDLAYSDIGHTHSYASTDHDQSHILGGADVIDGDKLEISWNPTNSIPDSVPDYSDNLDHLTSHLKGIDAAIGGKSDSGHTHSYASDNHDATHITSGSDEIDGDKLDIDWNPSNYTPATVEDYADSVDNLTAHLKGVDDALILKQNISSPPATFPYTWYWADQSFLAKTVSVAADRYKLLTPNAIQIDIGGSSYTLSAQATLDLSQEATWDTVSGTDYRTASNRAGKDFYVYAVQPVSGSVPEFKVSANSTVPSGYTSGNSRKLGGFHCLCGSMSTPASRANSTAYAIGYTVQPATPNGYWYRSACNKMWVASTAFSSGDLVMAKAGSQNIYECTTAGTSVGSAPTWPDSGTVSDGGITWTYRGDASTTTSLVSGGSPPTFGTTVGGFTLDGNVQWLCEAIPATDGYVQGDIIPNSVWDLKFRAANGNNAGMAYVDGIDAWVDIYLASGTGTSTASAYNATIMGARDWMDSNDDGTAVKKRMLKDFEFQRAAFGSNEETNTTGSAPPNTAGNHTDMFGRRMISAYFLEDCCGTMWQWLDEQSYRFSDPMAHTHTETGSTTSVASADISPAGYSYDLRGSKGSQYRLGTYGDVKLLAGGWWVYAAASGSRARGSNNPRWTVNAAFGSRFAARSITK